MMDYASNIQQYLQKHGFEAFHPKAVLFDMDGVLFDSMPPHAVSWHESMKSCGLDMSYNDAYRYEGMRGIETIRLLARQQWQRELTDNEATRLYRMKTERFAQCPPARKMEGVEQLMRKIKNDGLAIGIVTGSGQHTLLNQLEKAFPDLLDRKKIVTSFDVSQGKPNPAPYLTGMRKCGVLPWEAIVIENAPLGVRAAVAAKAFTIAVNTGPLPDEMLLNEGANLIFGRMTALRDEWEKLKELF